MTAKAVFSVVESLLLLRVYFLSCGQILREASFVFNVQNKKKHDLFALI